MNWIRRVLIGLLIFIVLLLIVNVGLNYWISAKLPAIINNENDSSYQITYEDLDVSLLSRNIVARDIVLVPKSSLVNKNTKEGMYAKIQSIEVRRFEVFNMLWNDKLKAHSIDIVKPEIIVYELTEDRTNHAGSIEEKVVKPFRKIVLVSEIEMTQGDLKILYVKSNDPIMHVSNIAFEVNGIILTDDILEQKIPFGFGDYKVSFDSIYYRPNSSYGIRAGGFKTNNTSLSFNDFTYLPRISRAKFIANLPAEKDLFTIKTGKIKIDSIKWGFKDENFFFHAQALQIDDASANIYRGKMPPDDLTKKPLYNKLLRDIDFDLRIDKLTLRRAMLEYEEEKTFEKGAGQLTFSNFYMTAANIRSGFQQKQLPDVMIDIKCRFMNVSPMDVKWSFNVHDQTDGFKIRGSILKFPAEKLTPFVKPYMNLTATGMLDKVYFNFNGNDKMSRGDFAIEYEDLKVDILQKDRKNKNKVLSAIANLFIKKDTKERIKETTVEVERIPEKSFFNLLWRSVGDGLKKLLI